MSDQHRRGVFLGGYVPAYMKEWLRHRAERRGHSLTQELIDLLARAKREDEDFEHNTPAVKRD